MPNGHQIIKLLKASMNEVASYVSFNIKTDMILLTLQLEQSRPLSDGGFIEKPPQKITLLTINANEDVHRVVSFRKLTLEKR